MFLNMILMRTIVKLVAIVNCIDTLPVELNLVRTTFKGFKKGTIFIESGAVDIQMQIGI
jgi:hypothetical protein